MTTTKLRSQKHSGGLIALLILLATLSPFRSLRPAVTQAQSVSGAGQGTAPLDVPYVSELEVNPAEPQEGLRGWDNCGPAALAMAIAYLRGVTFPDEVSAQAALNSQVDDVRGGSANRYVEGFTGPDQWDPALTKEGYTANPVTDWDGITENIDNGIPVVVAVKNNLFDNPPYPRTPDWTPDVAGSNHVVVVTGYDDANVYINDPLADPDLPSVGPDGGKNWRVGKASFLSAADPDNTGAMTADFLQPAPPARPAAPASGAPRMGSGSWVVFAGVGAPSGQLYDPLGVAVDHQGDVYVSEGESNHILKLGSSGQVLAQWGTGGSGPGQLGFPTGLTVDGLGNLYVAEAGNNRIQKLSPSGQSLALWGSGGSGPGQFGLPQGVAVDGQGNIYVADPLNDRVQKLSASGQPLAQWGSLGTGPGQFNGPIDVALDGAGSVYVTDTGNNRVQKLTSDGRFVAQWGSLGSGPGQFNQPRGIAVDGAGNMYVVDWRNNQIQVLSPTGQPLGRWNTAGSAPGQFAHPFGIALDDQQNMYVADLDNTRVQKLVLGP